jgi:hypothetical protein
MEKAAGHPVHIAVLLRWFTPQEGPVTCIVSGVGDGHAALEMARRICENSQQELQVLVPVLPNGDARGASAIRMPEWIRSAVTGAKARVLHVKDPVLRPQDVPVGIAVIAKDVADQFRLDSELLRGERNMLLVQGAEAPQIRVQVSPVEFNPAAAAAGPV